MADSTFRDSMIQLAKTSLYIKKIQTCYAIEKETITMALSP